MHVALIDRVIAYLVASVVALRLCLESNFLNSFMGYTSGSGSVVGRFHPGTYLLLAVVVLYLMRGRVRFIPLIDLSICASVVATGLALSNGGLNAASVIVDTELAGLIIARFVVVGSDRARANLLKVIVTILLFNLLLVVAEKITSFALIPRAGTEQYFRPQGLLDHPLTVGWTCCFGMWGVLMSDYRRRNATLLNFLLLTEVVFCSVRFPLIISGGLFILTLVSIGGRGIAGRLGATSLALLVAPILVVVAASLGLLDRFIDLGLYDDKSAASRINSWSLLSQISDASLWHGMDNEAVNALMATNKINYIENSFVMFVLVSGIVSAVLVHIAVLVATSPVWRRSPSYLMVLAGVLIGSISVSTKSVVIVIAFVMAAIFYRRESTALAFQQSTA